MIDFIGDIHGHADKLESLLKKLGYTQKKGGYSHSERKVLFVGDYIDRGPQIPKTLSIVKSMVDEGSAIALMGNHEYNAICFQEHAEDGGHLRPHNIDNILQHQKTLEQFKNRQEAYNDSIEWFKTLPLFYETEYFRAVHACWDKNHIDLLKGYLIDGRLTDTTVKQSAKKGTPLFDSVEQTLKGKEMDMPNNLFFTDKDGKQRGEIRIKWWENPESMTYKSISVIPIDYLPDTQIETPLTQFEHYGTDERPVFFGHYWLQGTPQLLKDNVCCLDYSVAKNGVLMAYRFNGEQSLDPNNIVFV